MLATYAEKDPFHGGHGLALDYIRNVYHMYNVWGQEQRMECVKCGRWGVNDEQPGQGGVSFLGYVEDAEFSDE